MELKLQGKKALITGSSSGIGEAIAKCLAGEGAQVMIQGRNENELKRVVQEIKASGGQADYTKGDLTKDDEAQSVVKKTLETFESLDILVNNAGAFPPKDWIQSTPQDWLDLYNTNVVSMVRMIHAFLPQMKKSGWGRIIQIASVAGDSPGASYPVYGATKAANINMTISLAKELAGTGVTVNTVSPGPILTPGVHEMLQKIGAEKNWGNNLKEIEKIAAKEMFPTMVRRFGRPEEVGNLVTFIASPLADFINGSNFRVDGGRLA